MGAIGSMSHLLPPSVCRPSDEAAVWCGVGLDLVNLTWPPGTLFFAGSLGVLYLCNVSAGTTPHGFHKPYFIIISLIISIIHLIIQH